MNMAFGQATNIKNKKISTWLHAILEKDRVQSDTKTFKNSWTLLWKHKLQIIFYIQNYKCYMEAKNYLDLKCQMKKNGNSWEFITNLPSFIGSYKFCMKPNFIGLYKNHMNYVLWLIWMIFVHIQYLKYLNG